jgi:hypothetical protein
MPHISPFTINLSSAEERELRRRAAQYTTPYFKVVRASWLHQIESFFSIFQRKVLSPNKKPPHRLPKIRQRTSQLED